MKCYATFVVLLGFFLLFVLSGCVTGSGGGTWCVNSSSDWIMANLNIGYSVGWLWYTLEQQHWRQRITPGLRHCIVYYIKDGSRIYIDPQLGYIYLTERELKSAIFIGP